MKIVKKGQKGGGDLSNYSTPPGWPVNDHSPSQVQSLLSSEQPWTVNSETNEILNNISLTLKDLVGSIKKQEASIETLSKQLPENQFIRIM